MAPDLFMSIIRNKNVQKPQMNIELDQILKHPLLSEYLSTKEIKMPYTCDNVQNMVKMLKLDETYLKNTINHLQRLFKPFLILNN